MTSSVFAIKLVKMTDVKRVKTTIKFTLSSNMSAGPISDKATYIDHTLFGKNSVHVMTQLFWSYCRSQI